MDHKYIKTIERLYKSQHLKSDDPSKATKEIIKQSALLLNCERINVWAFNQKKDVLECIQSYLLSRNRFVEQEKLTAKSIPNYFNYIKKGKIFVSNIAESTPMHKELLDSYIYPLNIKSMIDVPIRSQGELIGMICFEYVGQEHVWSVEEQTYTLSVAQLLTPIFKPLKIGSVASVKKCQKTYLLKLINLQN